MGSAYKARKAAQVVAYLLQGRGGRSEIIDVIKLVYLADRTFMDWYDRPMLYDDFFCMTHGPVNSATYDAIKLEDKLERPWSDYLIPRRGHDIELIKKLQSRDFDELSRAEERVLYEVLEEHKHRRGFALVDWIHDNCREWSNPRGTSVPLLYFEIWKALGRDNLEELDQHANEMKNLASALDI
jgi:uncharacterized phage-associated protein